MKRQSLLVIIGILLLVTSATAAVSQYNQSNGEKTVIIFNGTGTINWTAPTGLTSVEYLIIGGGGGGGYQYGGGGGAGGFCTTASYAVTAGNNYTIVVGAGGAGASANNGAKGENSSFDAIVALGGGGGWLCGADGAAPPATANGSSGGGGGVPPTVYTVLGGYGTTGQGYNGGTGYRLAGGGGGGAGQIGENAGTDGSNYGGDGGNGLTSDITGTVTTYAGGGGGLGWAVIGTGGTGGGGNGNLIGSGTPTSGTNGLGGGGGGASGSGSLPGGNGGSGVVIISYSIAGVPIPSFTSDEVSGLAPLAVQFNDTSVTTPTAWNWSFKHITPGNNTEIWWSTLQNPTNTFAAGDYNIHLNVSNASGSTITIADYIITVSNDVGYTTSYYGSYTVLVWNISGASEWTAPTGVSSVEYLVVGGGGGGGTQYGGGGGAGGVKNGTLAVTAGTEYPVKIGAGGLGFTPPTLIGGNGGTSNFSTIGVTGGGGGGGSTDGIPVIGGSGGGGGVPTSGTIAGAAGISGEGQSGGSGYRYGAGGGGGNQTAGQNGGATGTNIGGNGGNGISNSITGIATYYAGGGGGYGWTGVTASNGGLGGGGKGGVLGGVSPTNGTNGLGGGGGGTGENGTQLYASGGNGTVILRYILAGTPNASFTSDAVSGVEPLTVQFTDTSITTPTAWNWSFKHVTPGNNTEIWWSTLQNPTNTFATGSYNIHLNVTNASGFAITSADYIITISDAPQPSTAQFSMITSGESYPSGALTEDPDNPTMSAITFGETTEYSIIQELVSEISRDISDHLVY
jgi:PKD repeat protein